jgi:hypothetical protein
MLWERSTQGSSPLKGYGPVRGGCMGKGHSAHEREKYGGKDSCEGASCIKYDFSGQNRY